MQPFEKLEKHFADYMALRRIDVLLDWDRSVMMPPEGSAQRAREIAVLNLRMHDMLSDPHVGEWIDATDRKTLDAWGLANLDMMQRLHLNATAVPADLIERKMMQETKTEMVWRSAKAASDFAMVLPELEKMVAITREYAEAKAQKLNAATPYDALMDHFAPYMTSAEVDVIFDDLSAFLPSFINEVIERQPETLPLTGPFPIALQEQAGWVTAECLGMDKSWARLDTSAHPFSMGVNGDVRITTRYCENDFMNGTVAHEAGHGLYDRNTPASRRDQPAGISQHMGMVVHESQSLSLQMQLGCSREYWNFMAPKLQKIYGRSGPEMSAENLYRHATKVARGFIRIDADEVTYPAHVILRYRLEKDMVHGKLAVKDLPQLWAAGMSELIGVAPPDDKRGCLQDIHWHAGMFGYFPAYALGEILAAQFGAAMKRDIPNIADHVRKGEINVYTNWLRDNVHQHACLYKPNALIEKVTGQKMSAQFFKDHLINRYMEGKAWSSTSAPVAKRHA